MACEHGEAGTHRRHHAATDAPWHDPLMLPLASPQFAAETSSPFGRPYRIVDYLLLAGLV